MTDAERLGRIKRNLAEGYSYRGERGELPGVERAKDDAKWLLAEVERLRVVVKAELARHEPKSDGLRQQPICRSCVVSELSRSSDNRWACSAGMRLSAALADLEGKG